MPRISLHLDGLAIAVLCIVAFALTAPNWVLFGLLILAPDLFMLGYLAGPSAGAFVYNFGHSLIWPVVLVGLAVFGILPGALAVGLIWGAHIGVDRIFGYGYKYPDTFGHTHFTEV